MVHEVKEKFKSNWLDETMLYPSTQLGCGTF